MHDAPAPPIVVEDNGDILIFSSVEAACAELEAIDVEDGVYNAWDSKGRRLALRSQDGVVHIGLDTNGAREPDVLARRLMDFAERVGLRRIGIDVNESIPLASLIERLHAFLGYP